MRFIRTKTVVTRLFDGAIDDMESILKILRDIQEKEYTCTLEIKGRPRTFESARIVNLNTDEPPTFTCSICGKNSNLKVSDEVSKITELSLDTADEITVQTKSDVTRWDLLNPADESYSETESESEVKNGNSGLCSHTPTQ